MLQEIATFLVRYVVFALMLSIGLALRLEDLKRAWRAPRLFVRTLFVMLVAVPMLAIVVVSLFDLTRMQAGLILLMAICPGAPFIPLITRTKGTEFSPVGLVLLLFASALAPLTIPAWLLLLDRIFPHELAIPSAKLALVVVTSVAIPLAVGVVVRRFLPRVADVLARVTHGFFLVALVVALAAALWFGGRVLVNADLATLGAVATMVVGAAAMGYWSGEPAPEARGTTTVAVVLGHPGMALAVVAASHPELRAAAFIVAYLLARGLLLIPIRLWLGRRDRRRPGPARATPPGGPREVTP